MILTIFQQNRRLIIYKFLNLYIHLSNLILFFTSYCISTANFQLWRRQFFITTMASNKHVETCFDLKFNIILRYSQTYLRKECFIPCILEHLFDKRNAIYYETYFKVSDNGSFFSDYIASRNYNTRRRKNIKLV